MEPCRAGSAGEDCSNQEGKSVAIPAGRGLAGNLIESLLTDREGRLWVGTDAGLNRLRRKSLFTLSQSEGLWFRRRSGSGRSYARRGLGGQTERRPYRWDGKSFSRSVHRRFIAA